MSGQLNHEPGDEALQQAAEWHARLQRADAVAEDFAAFSLWLEADAGRRLAYDRIEDLYALLDAVELVEPVTPRRWWPRLAVGVGLMSLLAALLWAPWRDGRVEQYATKAGQTRELRLADGTALTLNANTAIAVHFTPSQRAITLQHGEALLRVVADPSRPLLVRAGATELHDIGTMFDVVRESGRTVVAVAEGRVAVAQNGAPPAQWVELSAGDRMVRSDDGAEVVGRVDPMAVDGWSHGYLIYRDAALSDVVADLNRYFPQPVLLQDGPTGAMRFSGVLKIDSEQAMLRRLSGLLPLRVAQAADGGVTLSRAPGGN